MYGRNELTDVQVGGTVTYSANKWEKIDLQVSDALWDF